MADCNHPGILVNEETTGMERDIEMLFYGLKCRLCPETTGSPDTAADLSSHS